MSALTTTSNRNLAAKNGCRQVAVTALSPGDTMVIGFKGGKPLLGTIKAIRGLKSAEVTITFADGNFTKVPGNAQVAIPGPATINGTASEYTAGYTTIVKHPVEKKAKAAKVTNVKGDAIMEIHTHNLDKADLAAFDFSLTAGEITAIDPRIYVEAMKDLEHIAVEFSAWQSPGGDRYTFRGQAPIGLLEPVMYALAKVVGREVDSVARRA